MFHIYYNNDYSDPMGWSAVCIGWRVEFGHTVTTGDFLAFEAKYSGSKVECSGVLDHQLTYIELDQRGQRLGSRGCPAYLLVGKVPLLVYQEDTPRALDDAGLQQTLAACGAFPDAYRDMFEDAFSDQWKLIDEAPHVWLHCAHASGTIHFGNRGYAKNIDLAYSTGTPLDLSRETRKNLEKAFAKRSKKVTLRGKPGWVLDVSAHG